MISTIDLKGWIELEGERLSEEDLCRILFNNPRIVSKFGGEFLLKWDEYKARDHFGIMEGDCPPGKVFCKNLEKYSVNPLFPPMELGKAIEIAVQMRNDEGIVAFSGGVDSALLAKLALRECITVGLSGSHDLMRSKQVSSEMGLKLHSVIIDPLRIEDALKQVLQVIPRKDPVNASIATTLYFVTEWAESHGFQRILAGQGADELFGGYARYLRTESLRDDLEKDFVDLKLQLARDQATAALHETYFSLPYLDVRVVQSARSISPSEKVRGGVRKYPLREVATRYIPRSVAYFDKKAMQYGSGVMKEIKKLAKKRGFGSCLNDYISTLA